MRSLLFLLVIPALIEASPKRLRPGFKQERINDKFVLTSTREGNAGHDPKGKAEVGCIRIDIHVPENFDPMKLCLRLKSAGNKMAGFHKDFKLRIPDSKGRKTELNIRDILAQNKAVDGHVLGLGVSFVNGYFSDKAFYGTLVYRHLTRDHLVTCSILPLHQLGDFVNLGKMDEEERQEFMTRKTVKKFRDLGPNAIVTCGDMHRNDEHDVENPFSFTGPQNPTNVKLETKPRLSKNTVSNGASMKPRLSKNTVGNGAPMEPRLNKTVNVDGRQKRDIVLTRNVTEENATGQAAPPVAEPPAQLPGGALGGIADPPGGPGKNITQAPKMTKEEIKANKTLGKFVKTDKHGSYYASVCFIVDADYLERRFNNTPEQATLLLGGFVEVADWILRSTDWNMDGVPDNIGIRLLEVNIQYMTKELKSSDEKWGRADNGTFKKRDEIFNFLRVVGKHMNPDCDIRSGIGEVNTAKFVLHEPGGCTACKHNFLTSFVNPYVEKFSPRGEQLRLMYHEIRILTFGFVYTKGFCANCSGVTNSTKKSVVATTFESGESDWGACIVEGDMQSRSNIPLNSFRFSVCSRDDGVTCLKDLAARNNCLQFEPEYSYCGNGIVEADEECDCGNLATCAEEACLCSPRSGRDPCRKLSPVDQQLCFTLIRCRGFRFLHETGQGNGSHFMQAFSTFVDGPGYSKGGRRFDADLEEREAMMMNRGFTSKLTLTLVMTLVIANFGLQFRSVCIFTY